MITSDKVDIEYNKVRLEIMKAETEEEKENAKKSIRAFAEAYEVDIMIEMLWDAYELFINKKTKQCKD